MSMGDLVWLFFIFSAIQPMLRQQMLEAMRVRKISQLERERKSRVIMLVHRQETMRLLGFPIARYIDINDSEDVLRAIQMTDADVPLDLVLHTPGGLVLAALQIAKAVRAPSRRSDTRSNARGLPHQGRRGEAGGENRRSNAGIGRCRTQGNCASQA